MEVRLYNSLTNKIETLTPIKDGEVSMYVCGPTVYNFPHIGNMRPVVTFDTLRRFLEYIGYKVTYVSNFTDVDDKIINAAKAEGKSEKDLADFYIREFRNAIHGLGSLDPNITPRVTEYIDAIISYISNLVNLNAAYVSDGDVYFRVSKISDYGCLSNISIDDLIVGARVEESTKKESPLDFALWKKTNEGINWDSPWGRGRPGWHTECCVMIDTIFHNKIDIHGGGYDLKFPHHENEIAQCEATHHHKIANIWMHNAFVNINNEKMSKSLGNVIYAKDLIKEYRGNVVRMVMLNTHYRLPVAFNDETIQASISQIARITTTYKQVALALQKNDVDLSQGRPTYINKFLEALASDLNTSNAVTELYDVIKQSNQALRSKDFNPNLLNDCFKTLSDMFAILGLEFTYVTLTDEDKELIKMFDKSRAEKNYSESDRLRDILIQKGIY